MAVQSPPFALQNSSHSAALFRQAVTANMQTAGIVNYGDYGVSAQSTPNMSVKIAAGMAWVNGSQVAAISGTNWDTQACYFALNDGSVTVTISAANATNPRIDLVYVAVQDSFYSGATNTAVLGVVTGTPAATPTVPALPSNALALAQVAVAANATSITNSNISALTSANAGRATPSNTIIPCTSTTRPSTTFLFGGQLILEFDTSRVWMWTGAAWAYQWGGTTPTGALSIASGYSSGPWGPPLWRQGGGSRMALQGSLTNSSAGYTATAATENQIATLPAGTAPASKLAYPIAFGNGSAYVAGIVTIHTDGTVWYIPSTAVSVSAGQLSLSLSGIEWVTGV